MKDQLNPTPPGIPPVFIEAAKEAGESLEGWSERSNGRCIVKMAGNPSPVYIYVWSDCEDEYPIRVYIGDNWVSPVQSLPAAIRLANRLVRALEGETETPASHDNGAGEVTGLTMYLVGGDGDEQLTCVEAETPEKAWESYAHDFGIEPEDASGYRVWSVNPCRSVVDVEHALIMQSDSEPEESPLEESWDSFVGKEKIAALQAVIDAHIAEHFPVYYLAQDELYRPAPPSGGEGG